MLCKARPVHVATISAGVVSGVLSISSEANMIVLKTCACGRQYTVDTWRKLATGSRVSMVAFAGSRLNGEPWGVDLRHCVCGSTITITIDEDGMPSDKGML